MLSLLLIRILFAGRQHYKQIQFCMCMPRAHTLVRLGYWPVTPHMPTTAIHLRFMEKSTAFLLEGPVALRKFCSAMAHYNKTMPKYTCYEQNVSIVSTQLPFKLSQSINAAHFFNFNINIYRYLF